MRLVRLGDETCAVAADVRAALASWGRGDTVVGGVALLGCTPAQCPRPVDAVVVLPRGVLVVVGVDLPDPAVRLDAPLASQWKTDGWPLVRPDGAVNPAKEALALVECITGHLESERVEPLPVGTVVAIGPYVSQVHQPTSDLNRGVRILHPEPMTLLTASRELAVRQRPCTVAQARQILTALEPNNATVAAIDLAAEGFADTVAADLGTDSTTLIPRVPTTPRAGASARRTGTAGGDRPGPSRPSGAKRPASGTRKLRMLPVSAAVLVAMLLLTGIVFAVTSAGDDEADPQPTGSTTAQVDTVEIDGTTFVDKGAATETNCAEHAYGDVEVWLERNRCDELVRMRFESAVGDKTAAVLVAVLRFPESAVAAEFLAAADKPGSGAIADASADGTPWPGEKQPFFESAAFTSGQEGNSVKIVQAVWINEPSTPDNPELGTLATKALQIPAP